MRRFQRWLCLVVYMILLAGVASGCIDPASNKKNNNATITPAEHFRATQGPTITTHGKIRMDSVEEKDGKIHYQTEDGKRWRVDMILQSDKTYKYGTPEEVL